MAWVGVALKWTSHCREIASWPIILAPPLSTRALWAGTSNLTLPRLHTMNWRLGVRPQLTGNHDLTFRRGSHFARLTCGRFVRQPTSARQQTTEAPSQSIVCLLSVFELPRVERDI